MSSRHRRATARRRDDPRAARGTRSLPSDESSPVGTIIAPALTLPFSIAAMLSYFFFERFAASEAVIGALFAATRVTHLPSSLLPMTWPLRPPSRCGALVPAQRRPGRAGRADTPVVCAGTRRTRGAHVCIGHHQPRAPRGVSCRSDRCWRTRRLGILARPADHGSCTEGLRAAVLARVSRRSPSGGRNAHRR
jgi:hypothetical protein